MMRFIKLREENLAMIMRWRLKPEVSEYLFTDVENDMDKQLQWFKRVSQDDTCRYWLIYYQDIPIGVINLAAIDLVNKRCSAGYYIGEMDYRQLGAMILPYLYNYVFLKMKLKKIYGEVMAENKSILQIHKMHGFRQVGSYQKHIFKKGRFHDVILIELMAESWLQKKRYQHYIADFE
jgi:UDP-4-amino-4,6-dideoxy-N-acetyl-beta-L-altrosamine N-acetyltransferase